VLCILSLSVALVIQHAKHIQRIVICVLSGSTIFLHVILKSYLFRKQKKIENKICVLIFSTTLSEMFLILRRIDGGMIKNI